MPVVNTEDRFSVWLRYGRSCFDSEPMQVGRAHLSREEKERHRKPRDYVYTAVLLRVTLRTQCTVKAKARQ